MDTFFNTVGTIGTILLLTAYFLQMRALISSSGPAYLWLNLAGSMGIVVSLLRFWNLAAFLLDFAWALISLYGIIKLRMIKLRTEKI